jgi:protein-tyrosine phosphatase
MTQTRVLPPANLRDVAGLPTEDGGRTRPGVLLRSDAPLEGDPAPEVLAWPPGSVIDLRASRERHGPHPLAALGAEVHHVPLTDALAPEALARGEQGGLSMGELYVLLAEAAPGWLPQVVDVAAHGPAPTLVHCAAGKDRTGVAVAILLRLVGVTRPAVEADFVQTNARRVALRERLLAQGAREDDVPADRVGVRREHLVAVLDLLDDHPGGPAGFVHAAGVPDDDATAWRARLLG